MKIFKLFLFLSFLIFPFSMFAADIPEKSTRLVTDYAKVLDNTDNIEQKLAEFQKNNFANLIVVIMPVNGDLMTYADKLFSGWQVGGKDDNGILLLIDSENKQGILKLSYGLNEKVDGNQINELVTNGINSSLSEGNYSGAINIATKNLEKILKGEYNGVQAKSDNNWVFGIIFLFIALSIVIASAYGRQERRRLVYQKPKE